MIKVYSLILYSYKGSRKLKQVKNGNPLCFSCLVCVGKKKFTLCGRTPCVLTLLKPLFQGNFSLVKTLSLQYWQGQCQVGFSAIQVSLRQISSAIGTSLTWTPFSETFFFLNQHFFCSHGTISFCPFLATPIF